MQNTCTTIAFSLHVRGAAEDPCEDGFKNELLIQMYHRSYEPRTEVIFYMQKVDELCFVTCGRVDLFTNDGVKFFALPNRAVFGDYAMMYDLRSNISFRTTELPPAEDADSSDDDCTSGHTSLMCVSKEVFLNLCALYP